MDFFFGFPILDVNISSSEDEDVPAQRRPKRIRERINYFEDMNDEEFFARFRLRKITCLHILHLIEDEIRSPSERNDALSPTTKLLLTLRFYATGSMLIVVGDFLGVSKSSACITVKAVSEAIARLGAEYITFPNTVEGTERTKMEFYEIASFPNVLGAIDCTHVRIQSPGGDDAEEYRNRKGYFSWNVQVICDKNLKIQDIVARWPGRSHDQTIFNNCRAKARLETRQLNGLLLGDGGYGITNYLITPLLNPVRPEEVLFNELQIRTRNVVERMFGVWKRRFPILSLGMRVSLERSKVIIVACAVLHNMAINEGEGNPPAIDANNEVNEDVPAEVGINENVGFNNAKRQHLINNHFFNLL